MSEGSPRATDAAAPAPAQSGSSIDVIIELYKRDVDRTLLREQLRKSPAERLHDLQEMVRFLTEVRSGMQRRKT